MISRGYPPISTLNLLLNSFCFLLYGIVIFNLQTKRSGMPVWGWGSDTGAGSASRGGRHVHEAPRRGRPLAAAHYRQLRTRGGMYIHT